MRNFILIVWLVSLVACGSDPAPTPAPNYYLLTDISIQSSGWCRGSWGSWGSATWGSSCNSWTYTLSGSDNYGNEYEVDYALQKDDADNESSTITNNITSNAASTYDVEYYDENSELVKIEYDSGASVCTTSNYTGLPNTATIGQSGTVYVLACSDSTTETKTWTLEQADENNALLTITKLWTFDDGSVAQKTIYIFLLNESGSELELSIVRYTPPDFTITLSAQ